MDAFMMEVARCVFAVQALFESTRAYCADYLTEREPEFSVEVDRAALVREQRLLDIEADEEGLKRRKFSDMFLERSVIQRRVAEALIGKDTLMLHGSTVAVDGQAYLFTAPCGTGKSTHTRLWREVFGDRAVMVNDDKPFLKITDGAVIACGSPWTGKHGLGNNVSFPLKGICILSRGPENRICTLVPDDAADFLRSQCFVPEDSEQAGRALELLERLIRMVPLWKMECTKEPEAAITAYQAMK